MPVDKRSQTLSALALLTQSAQRAGVNRLRYGLFTPSPSPVIAAASSSVSFSAQILMPALRSHAPRFVSPSPAPALRVDDTGALDHLIGHVRYRREVLALGPQPGQLGVVLVVAEILSCGILPHLLPDLFEFGGVIGTPRKPARTGPGRIDMNRPGRSRTLGGGTWRPSCSTACRRPRR